MVNQNKKRLILALTIVIICIGGGVFLWSLIYNASACESVIRLKNLKDIVDCKTEGYALANGNITYVEVTYGPPSDCPSGCIYQKYSGLLKGRSLYDFYSSPNLSHLMFERYGEQCALDKYTDSLKFQRHIIQTGGSYYWEYDFNYYEVTKVDESKSEKAFILNKSTPFTSCIIDGNLTVKKVEFDTATEADFTNMNVKIENIQ